MSSPVYVFGPHAHPSAPSALRDALEEAYPSINFVVGETTTVTGIVAPTLACAPSTGRSISTTTYQQLVCFARGFVAGYQSRPNATRSEQRRYVTVPSTPAAKSKSEPPTPSQGTVSIRPERYPSGEGPLRFPTQLGIAPPSQR